MIDASGYSVGKDLGVYSQKTVLLHKVALFKCMQNAILVWNSEFLVLFFFFNTTTSFFYHVPVSCASKISADIS